jgi:oligoribonuclease NrnB/cAMP/cGMP phosphodiesterase (DHH superfamily)
MNTFCFYHKVDWDGNISAAIVKNFIPESILIPFDYNMELPLDLLNENDTVFFVDVSTQPYTRIFDVIGKVKKVVIIDHHKSFIEFSNNSELEYLSNVSLVLDPTYAACELTYLYFKNNSVLPTAIALAGQYDSWRNTKDKLKKYDVSWETVLHFQYGLKKHKLTPDGFFDKFINVPSERDVADNTIFEGTHILQYQDIENEMNLENNSFIKEMLGHKCLCLNSTNKSAKIFESKWDNDPSIDFAIRFSFDGIGWSYSVYSNRLDRDASEFAKNFGGGGHKGAAGFYLKDIYL